VATSELDEFDPALLTPEQARSLAVTDLRAAAGWLAFGIAVLVGSVRMDRLESQNINPYTVPGLLPGLLGIVFIVLALLLGVRSWRRGGGTRGARGLHVDAAVARRLALIIVLVVFYSVVLVGHGVPFWVASAIYVFASILLLQRPQRAAAGRNLTLKDVVFAAAVGLASGGIIQFVFQELFLVRLP
jgi:hypothetical protein